VPFNAECGPQITFFGKQNVPLLGSYVVHMLDFGGGWMFWRHYLTFSVLIVKNRMCPNVFLFYYPSFFWLLDSKLDPYINFEGNRKFLT